MVQKIETLPDWLANDAERNAGTLWQVVKAYRANLRQGTVGVKTRAMVKSTGKKPYKQKKTGSARRGSFVSPLHVGGGVAHGPKARDYREAIPSKMGSLALRMALAKRMVSGTVFEGPLAVNSGKTKDAALVLKSVRDLVGKTMVCLDRPSDETLRAYRNLRGVVLVRPEQINALDIVSSRLLVIEPAAMQRIKERLERSKE